MAKVGKGRGLPDKKKPVHATIRLRHGHDVWSALQEIAERLDTLEGEKGRKAAPVVPPKK